MKYSFDSYVLHKFHENLRVLVANAPSSVPSNISVSREQRLYSKHFLARRTHAMIFAVFVFNYPSSFG